MDREKMRTWLMKLSVATMLAGAFGMLFCFRFLWSAHLEDLVGAGFPFVGGAILFGCGLLSAVVLTQNKPQ